MLCVIDLIHLLEPILKGKANEHVADCFGGVVANKSHVSLELSQPVFVDEFAKQHSAHLIGSNLGQQVGHIFVDLS